MIQTTRLNTCICTQFANYANHADDGISNGKQVAALSRAVSCNRVREYAIVRNTEFSNGTEIVLGSDYSGSLKELR